VDRAARLALAEIKTFLERNTTVERVMLVCFGPEAYEEYCTALQQMVPE